MVFMTRVISNVRGQFFSKVHFLGSSLGFFILASHVWKRASYYVWIYLL